MPQKIRFVRENDANRNPSRLGGHRLSLYPPRRSLFQCRVKGILSQFIFTLSVLLVNFRFSFSSGSVVTNVLPPPRRGILEEVRGPVTFVLQKKSSVRGSAYHALMNSE